MTSTTIRLLGGTLAWPLKATAQQTNVERQVRIGMVSPVRPTAILKAFRDELRARGYVEGQNLTIDVRYVSGRTRAWLKTKNPDFQRR